MPGGVLAALLVGLHLRLQPGPGRKVPDLSILKCSGIPAPLMLRFLQGPVWVTPNACHSENSVLFISCWETDENRRKSLLRAQRAWASERPRMVWGFPCMGVVSEAEGIRNTGAMGCLGLESR